MDDTRADAPAYTAVDGTEPPRERSLWTKPGFVLSLALVVILVGCAVWLGTSRPATPAGRHPAPSAAAPVAHGCGPAGAPNQLPPAAAPVTDWRLVGHMAAPLSRTTGPVKQADGIPTCFSPDPTGALVAAANFLAAMTDSTLRPAALRDLTADTPGRAEALDQLARQGPGPDSYGLRITGFSFLHYGADGATVDLALAAQGGYVHLPLQLAWTGGDWRIVLPPTGRPFDSLTGIPTLTSYIPWQGA